MLQYWICSHRRTPVIENALVSEFVRCNNNSKASRVYQHNVHLGMASHGKLRPRSATGDIIQLICTN